MMLEVSADEVIGSEADLRARYRAPSELAIKKQQGHLDHNCRRFIALSPFLCLATAGEKGRTTRRAATPRASSRCRTSAPC